MSARVVVLVSGSGSNLQAILDARADGRLDADVVHVVSNVGDAFALQRAASAGVTTTVLERLDDELRGDYDARLVEVVAAHEPDLVVLAGWMRLLSSVFLDRFANRVVNLHPALPGEYPGLHAIERAFADAQAGRRDHTGVMVHLVPDEGVDDGPVIGSAVVPIEPNDTLADLEARVHAAERALLVAALADLIKEGLHEPHR